MLKQALFLGLIGVSLVGCQGVNSPSAVALDEAVYGSIGEQISSPRYVPPYSSSYQSHKTQLLALQKAGVVVIEKGGKLRLILPEDTFFKPQSSALRANKEDTLNMIANVVNDYNHSTVRVIGYSDPVGDQAYQKSLSLEYARVVSAYLWNLGVRVSSTAGAGNIHPVSSNRLNDGAADNRRVEVLVE